jgi:hypothetical protein
MRISTDYFTAKDVISKDAEITPEDVISKDAEITPEAQRAQRLLCFFCRQAP